MPTEIWRSDSPPSTTQGDSWECGIEYRVVPFGGLGFRQDSGRLWFVPAGGRRTALSDPQILAVINEVGQPLPGWSSPLPEDWLSRPRRQVAAEAIPPATVLRAMARLQNDSGILHPALAGYHTRAELLYLRGVAKGARDLARSLGDAHLASLCKGSAGALKEEQALQAMLMRAAERYKFWSEEVRRQTRFGSSLECLMEPLSVCFEAMFRRKAAGGWSQQKPAKQDAQNSADSPFLRFAGAYCTAIGCEFRPATLQSALYVYRAASQHSDAATNARVARVRRDLRSYRTARDRVRLVRKKIEEA